MKLFLLGATGRTGTHILDLARARGHEVTAFVRSPQKLAGVAGVRVVAGDALDRDALAAEMTGHDAVLSALGLPASQALRPSTRMSELGASTVAAMALAGVRRLGIVSAAVLFPEKGPLFAFFRWVLRHHARDLRSMEEVVRTSDLEWTIARPPRLTRGRGEGFRAADGQLPRGGGLAMSFRAVAAFLLDAVEKHAHVDQVVGLSRG
jgi:putative NADH-flavin reductase